MADLKITGLTADTTPTSDDLVPTVTDPAGTPANRKVTLANAITKAHGLSDGFIKVVSGVMSTVSSTLTVETPTGTVNGSNASFTVSAEPQWVVSDGLTYFDGAGYTYGALTITMDVAPSQYIRAIL